MDYTELTTRFSTEEDCLNYLYNIRWRNGYSCPKCECKEKWQVGNNKYKCKQCGYQSSVISGTIFHHTHLSMCQWFHAIWYVSMQKGLTTARGLQTELKLGSNRTALSILNKIKAEMYTKDESKINRYLNGTIDIYIDEFQENTTIILLVAVEVKNRKKGHIRIYQMPEYNTKVYHEFITNNIAYGSTIRKAEGNYKLTNNLKNYFFKTSEMEHYKAPYANYHEFITNNIAYGSTIRKAEGNYKLTNNLKNYFFKTSEMEHYKAPYANSVYSDFCKYYNQKLKADRKLSVAEIMDKYTYWTNSITNDITFDEILYNAVCRSPNPVVLK